MGGESTEAVEGAGAGAGGQGQQLEGCGGGQGDQGVLGMHVLENCLCSPQVSKGRFFFLTLLISGF